MNGRIKNSAMGFALAAAFLWAASQETFADDTARGGVAGATSVRMLQSELMVAALACQGEFRSRLIKNYNAFVHQFSPALIRSADILRSHFRETYGAKHRARFDSFLTHLANQASLNSIREVKYCEARAQMAETALSLNAGDLENFTIATYTANLAERAEDVPAAYDQPLAAHAKTRKASR